MDMKKRSAAIAEFRQNERKPKVLIVSLKAGGVGLNVMNYVFPFDINSTHLMDSLPALIMCSW